ncbi:hypothetical protein BHM03_00016131 [Ensete ventricosum]|uniref:Fatty acyl-CoA reductase n=1 Tax=Ensete ventricosum TaxID=4639 RepID=A0A445MEM7_ENSVE|nr:hypothetical protein BHM03_00016131 [Ensete ventricosum]
MGETLMGDSYLDIEAELSLADKKKRDLRAEDATEEAEKLAMKELGIKRTIDSVLIGYAKGKITCFFGDLDIIVPVDMVVNAMMATMATHAKQQAEFIYHMGSSVRKPVTYATVEHCVAAGFGEQRVRRGRSGSSRVRQAAGSGEGWLRDWRRGWSSDDGGGRVAAASSSCCGRGGRGKKYGRMGAAAAEKGAIVVDAGVAAAVWLKHGCAPAGWGCRRHMGATTATTKARMRCGSRKRRRRYCAPAGKKKERATAAKQRRQRGNSSSEEEWQAAANDGWQR